MKEGAGVYQNVIVLAALQLVGQWGKVMGWNTRVDTLLVFPRKRKTELWLDVRSALHDKVVKGWRSVVWKAEWQKEGDTWRKRGMNESVGEAGITEYT